MNKQLTLVLSFTAMSLAACGSDSTPANPDAMVPPPTPDAGPTGPTSVDVTDDVTADTTWTADHIYVLKKHIFVRGGTLHIEAGVKVLGETGSSVVITSAAKIDAQGTADAPIVFTSAQAEGSRLPGDWGGVVLLGLAPINVAGGTSAIEGFPAGTTGTEYGGGDNGHNCGAIHYARIEFAGFELAPDNELNGLTLGACGTATDIDHVQVHMGSDDGVEVFGGTVNIRHVLITQAQDDGLDWDFGWSGKAQFVIVQQSTFSNEGFEADNNKNDNDALPRSTPTIYNATLIGSNLGPVGANQKQMGMHLRRGTAGHLYNVIVAYFADFPVDIDGDATVAQTPDNLFIKNSIFFANGSQDNWVDPTDNDSLFDEGMYFTSEPTNKTIDPQVTGALSMTAPDFHPGAATSDMAATPPEADAFFDATATFVGAIGATDWTAGWTAYPEN